MYFLRSTFLGFLLIAAEFSFCGVASAQYFDCNTLSTTPDSLLQNQQAPAYQTTLDSAWIRIFVHVLRESDGTGGLSAAEIDSMLSVAAADLVSLDIYLYRVGQDSIPNSTFFAYPDSFAANLFATNAHSDAIDMYLGPGVGPAQGRAEGIPGSALVLGGALDSYSALSHLLGNCLGLYGTDETAFGVEDPDGSNAGSTGDLVIDTAADPGLFGWVESDCSLTAGFSTSFPDHDPDPSNIMSHAPMDCWAGFTESQRARVLTAVGTYEVLQEVVIPQGVESTYRNYSSFTNLANLEHYPDYCSNAAGFDFNDDGFKDIFVIGRYEAPGEDNHGCAGQAEYFGMYGVPVYSDATATVFPGNPITSPPHGTTGLIVADYDNDGDLDFYAPNPGWDVSTNYHRLFKNDGGYFTDVTATAFESGQVDIEGLTGSWGDFDGDGFLDLLVGIADTGASITSDEYSHSLALYHNQQVSGGDPTDREFIKVTGTGIGQADDGVFSMLWLDLDQDHDMDLVTIVFQQHHTDKSKFYRNDGGAFTDVSVTNFTARQNLEHAEVYAGAGDFDNDGDLDIAYHGKIVRGFFRNDLNPATGQSSLNTGWNEVQPANVQWLTNAHDLDVFDLDLDGLLDFGIANHYEKDGKGTANQRLYKNLPGQDAFEEHYVPGSNYLSESWGSVDWNRDGFTEFYSAWLEDDKFFYRNQEAADQTNTNHWIGIRLDAFTADPGDLPCNTRGIGATVIITAGSLVQAQVVDGGSGHAGQHDLDLSFGLGSYSGSVDIEVIWPCGQTTHDTLSPDSYHTIQLGWPEIDTYQAYLEWTPGLSVVEWVFEWETDYPSDLSLDEIEFPGGVPDGGTTVYVLDGSRPDVDFTVEKTATGAYKHIFRWQGRPCDQTLTVEYRIHSRALDKDFVAGRYLRVVNCPQS